jgi:short-subunit dehydrogenase
MTFRRILIVGATSAIAEAVARRMVRPEARFVLVGRRRLALEHIAADLQLRGAEAAEALEGDLARLDDLPALVEAASARLGGRIDLALVAHGTLTVQSRADEDADYARAEFHLNATASIELLRLLARALVAQGGGHLVVLSSVAGDRGRGSNALYGAAKAAVTAFAGGLGQRFRREGLVVTVVKPGFVDTPMTAAFKKGLLWAKPGAVAARIVAAARAGRPEVYAPALWWLVMAVIKAIPARIFRRLTL